MRAHLDVDSPSPSAIRLSWLCTFVECTGLRAAELLRARREHLYKTSTGWVLRVHGKGRRNRSVPVPSAAMAATRNYFASRSLYRLKSAVACAVSHELTKLHTSSIKATSTTIMLDKSHFDRQLDDAQALSSLRNISLNKHFCSIPTFIFASGSGRTRIPAIRIGAIS